MVPLSFLTPTPSKLERKKSTRFFFRPIRENILKLVFQSRILDALVCGWYPRRMENQVGPGDWKTQLRVGRYSIDLLWNLAPQDPPRNPSIIYYGQGISVYSGNYYRVYNVSECLGSAALALKPGQASKADASDQSNPVFPSATTGWSVPPSMLLLPATPITCSCPS